MKHYDGSRPKKYNTYDSLLKQMPILAHIGNEYDYELALELVEALMEKIGDNPDDPRWILLEIVIKSIDKYENHVCPEMASIFANHDDPIAIIRVLMEQYQLQPSEFPEIGNQELVHQVLNGQKKLNLNQVKAISQRFKIDPILFF